MVNQETKIVKAIEENDVTLFKKLFNKNYKPDEIKEILKIIIQCKHDNIEILKEILNNQSFFSISSFENSIFSISCILNKIKTVKYLIERPDFIFDKYYQDSFANVCSYGYKEIFDILYKHPKTDVSYNSNNCLYKAYSEHKMSIFKTLLNNENINPCINSHYLIIDFFDSREFEFINAILEHKSYKHLKEKLKDFDLNKLTNEKNYLLKILFSFKEYQEGIKLYLSDKKRQSDIEDLNKSLISNKVINF